MARKKLDGIEEKALSKGQLRKLVALRKSLGDEIANRAFAEWLGSTNVGAASNSDGAVAAIADALSELANNGKLTIPRGGYIVRRGRGRVIVERNDSTD